MQQIELSAGKDTESVYQLIGSLMQNNREFQVVITVPSIRGEEENTLDLQKINAVAAPEEKNYDLEQDVTDMIHEIGVPAHINDVCGGFRNDGFHYEDSVSYHCQKVPDNSKPRGTGHPSCN